MPKKAGIKTVKSGIGFDEIRASEGTTQASGHGSFVTSRTFRVLLAGAGFLADAYDLFVINLVLRLLRDEYPQYVTSGQVHAYEGAVASAALFGSIFGQIVAGSLADIIGRKKIFVATAILITIGSFGSALTMDNPELSIYTQIACWRFFLGAGVGGEYPLAATVTSESSSAARRGSLMAAVFAMQGVGALVSILVVMICLGAGASNSFAWRFSLAFGAVPVLLAFPWRLRMHETESFERVQQIRRDCSSMSLTYGSSNNDLTQYDRVADSSSHGRESTLAKINSQSQQQELPGPPAEAEFSRMAEIKNAFTGYKWHMLGTALSWFLLDVDFYANGLFNHDVTKLILSAGRATTAYEDAANSLILCLIGIPGYWLSVFFLETVGRKPVQLTGFLVMGVLFTICGLGHDWMLQEGAAEYRKWLFLLLYSLTFLFSNFGPNTTTFIIPGEIFPPEVKATCHGLSAASGKLGAATGAYIFPFLLASKHRTGSGSGSEGSLTGGSGLRDCMLVCALVAVMGAAVTHFFIPTYGAAELEDADSYIPLDHACLRPSEEAMNILEQAKEAKVAPYAMYEIIDASDSYSIDAFTVEHSNCGTELYTLSPATPLAKSRQSNLEDESGVELVENNDV